VTALRLLGFDGLIPRLSPTLLGDQFAQTALNVKLYSKELRYWRGPLLAYTPPPAAYQTLYRLFHNSGASAFLLWMNEVDVAVSPTADAAGESRIYYTGDGPPKKTNWAMATGGAEPYPSASQPMGITPPGAPPITTLTVVGTGTPESRAYVYTNISVFGAIRSESAPSPASALLSVPPVGSTVRVSDFYGPTAGENVTHRRIYRTVVGTATVSYQFVAEIPVATTFYDDSLTVAQLGEPIDTIGWLPPPVNLAGLVALPGGSLAGFVGNTVYFSEPHQPHAWPLAYAITLPVMKIVGLGVVGTSVAVMTGTTPFFIHGGVPGEMYTEKIPLQEPCVAKATIASDEDGVVYASPNGLVTLSPSERGLSTSNLFTADEWRPLIPATMKAAVLQGRYFGVFPNETPSRALVLSRTDPPALSFVQLPAIALHVDARNGFMFYVHDTDHKVYQMDADEATPLSYEWKSKRFFNEVAGTFSLLRVDADYSQLLDNSAYEAERAAVTAWNAAHYPGDLMGAINGAPLNEWEINGSILDNLPRPTSARTLQIVIYGDGGELRANLRPFSLDPIRIPAFKARQMEFSILGNVNVRSVHFATTIEELHAT